VATEDRTRLDAVLQGGIASWGPKRPWTQEAQARPRENRRSRRTTAGERARWGMSSHCLRSVREEEHLYVVVGASLSYPARLTGARAGRIMALEMVRSALRGEPTLGARPVDEGEEYEVL
jgi:hypothetical protein